jgi:hypothetical protein
VTAQCQVNLRFVRAVIAQSDIVQKLGQARSLRISTFAEPIEHISESMLIVFA